MDAAEQLTQAMAAVTMEAWSAAALAQLHTDAVPAARRLSPLTGGRPPVMPAEIQMPDRTPFAGHVVDSLAWVTQGMHQQHFTGSEALTQQACELLCALTDVLVWALVADETWPSSSSRSQERTAFGRLLQQDDLAERIMPALANTARQLNQHVFQRPASVHAQLLMVAARCCQNISCMLEGWRTELVQGGTVEHRHQGNRLVRWCIDSQLLCCLAEGYLLVLGMDHTPFLGSPSPRALDILAFIVLIAMNGAQSLQGFVGPIAIWMERSADECSQTPLKVGLQGTGSDGTTPAPFLRLTLLLLAIGQHWRRSAALASGSSPLTPGGSPEAVAALRAALQQQLTPSCAAQLVQRVAPAYWFVVTGDKVVREHSAIATQSGEDLGKGNIDKRLWDLMQMLDMYEAGNTRSCWTLGPQELQVVMECAELDAATCRRPGTRWATLKAALHVCPYPALAEFSAQHSRTLLTLAERCVDATLAAAAAAAAAPGGTGSSSSGSSRGTQAAAADDAGSSSSRDRSGGTQLGGAVKLDLLAEASALVGCLGTCSVGDEQVRASAVSSGVQQAAGYPTDTTWALLDPPPDPRLLRVLEALLRGSNSRAFPAQYLLSVLPGNLPAMQQFYSSPPTTRAVLGAVSSLTKWLQASLVTLSTLLQHPTDTAAAAGEDTAAGLSCVAGRLGGVHEDTSVQNPETLWRATIDGSIRLADLAVRNLGRAALLLDSVTLEEPAAVAAAAMSGCAGSSNRAWFMEQVLSAGPQPGQGAVLGRADCNLAVYKALLEELGPGPQPLHGIAQRLQPEFTAMHQAAAARQAAALGKKQGTDAAAIAEQLQTLHLGVGVSNAGDGPPAHAAAAASIPAAAAAVCVSSTSVASSPGGVPAGTPGDVTVAANALLVACKAAGALQGALQLLVEFVTGSMGHKLMPVDSAHLASQHRQIHRLSAAVQELAEWAVLLHPLLVQVLPAEHGQVLVGLAGRLAGSSSSSSSSRLFGRLVGMVSQQVPESKLSDAEVAAVLGALQHVVIPEQPGCSNPRCCCMEGVSEAAMQTQVCVACRGARYCSTACQRAHWKGGHKEACKAVQAATEAAAEAAVGSSLGHNG